MNFKHFWLADQMTSADLLFDDLFHMVWYLVHAIILNNSLYQELWWRISLKCDLEKNPDESEEKYNEYYDIYFYYVITTLPYYF